MLLPIRVYIKYKSLDLTQWIFFEVLKNMVSTTHTSSFS